jgi:hypothetical protein
MSMHSQSNENDEKTKENEMRWMVAIGKKCGR